MERPLPWTRADPQSDSDILNSSLTLASSIFIFSEEDMLSGWKYCTNHIWSHQSSKTLNAGNSDQEENYFMENKENYFMENKQLTHITKLLQLFSSENTSFQKVADKFCQLNKDTLECDAKYDPI